MSDFRLIDRLVCSVLRWLAIRVPFTAVIEPLREKGKIELVRFLPGLTSSACSLDYLHLFHTPESSFCIDMN
jgi:hypothetical protein